MKNSKEYSKRLQKQYRSLRSKRGKVEKLTYDEPTEAVVYAILSEHVKAKTVDAGQKHFAEYFVDLNDLRVSRPDEIVEMLGEDTAEIRAAAGAMTRVLRAIFNEYHKVSLDSLKKMGKRPAKHVLEKIDGMTRFAVDYCMLTSLQSHAIPLTERMMEYLKENDLIHPDSDVEETGGFLAKQIPAKNGYEFYSLFRAASESGRAKSKKKQKTKTKTVREVAKKSSKVRKKSKKVKVKGKK